MHNKSCFILTRCLIINCQDIQRNALHDLQTTNGEGMKKDTYQGSIIQCSYTILRVSSLGIEGSRESFPSKKKKSHSSLSCIGI